MSYINIYMKKKKLKKEDIKRLEKETKRQLKETKERNKELRLKVQSFLGRTGQLPDLDSTPPGSSK